MVMVGPKTRETKISAWNESTQWRIHIMKVQKTGAVFSG